MLRAQPSPQENPFMDDMASVYAPITKSFEQEDGTLLVEGIITDGGLDLDQQRCDPAWLKRAVPDWFAVGNLREQHDAHRAVGKAVEHADLGDEGHFIRGRIVDPVAVAKARAGIFSGFSVGIKAPRISKSADAPGGVITDGQIIEVSLVDRPCNSRATLTVCKAAAPGMTVNGADFDEDRGLVRCEELVETPDVVDKAVESAEKALDVTEAAVDGLTVSLADALPPEQAEKLAAAADPIDVPGKVEAPVVEKAADEAPAAAPVDDNGNGGDAPAFDVDAAKALVDEVLAKAEGDEEVMEMTPMAPPSDETVASVAISLIAGLIQSEAQGMVDNPGEDLDIKCLLNAVDALRWFIRRERQEGDAGGESDSAPYEYAEMAATSDAEKTIDSVAVIGATETEKAAEPVERNELGDLAPADAVTRIKSVSADQAEAIAKATVDNAFDELAASIAAQRGDDPAPAAKAATPETAKAATVETDGDALVKALSAALEKADSPLRNAFDAMITKATETTAEAVTELTARLVKVESMAVPGGPALRRTEVERSNARRTDLEIEVARYMAKAANATDVDLRKGYAARAAQLEAELKAIKAL